MGNIHKDGNGGGHVMVRKGGGNGGGKEAFFGETGAPKPSAARAKRVEKKNLTTVDEFGFEIEAGEAEYDYNQHMRRIDGAVYGRDGTWLKDDGDDRGASSAAGGDEGDAFDDGNDEEVDRGLESITLSARGMDPDIHSALFNDDGEGDEFAGENALLDDFIEVAMGKVDEDEMVRRGYVDDNASNELTNSSGGGAAATAAEEFDFDAHVARLLEKAGKEDDMSRGAARGGYTGGKGGTLDGIKRYERAEDGEIGAGNDEDIDAAYLRALEEYDDDEIGELEYNAGVYDDEDEDENEDEDEDENDGNDNDGDDNNNNNYYNGVDEAVGNVANLSNVLNVPRMEVSDANFISNVLENYVMGGEVKTSLGGGPSGKKEGGSGYRALVDGKMMGGSELVEAIENLNVAAGSSNNDDDDDDDDDDNAGIEFNQAVLPPPPEDVRIDGESYFDYKPPNKFDCESVLTTASNVDNRPSEIGYDGRKGGRKKKKDKVSAGREGRYEVIELSKKTGLPIMRRRQDQAEEELGEEEEDFEAADGASNKGQSRSKSETASEKKLRKQRVKLEKSERRREKKGNKIAYKEGGKDLEVKDGLGGRSVFKYT